MTLHRVLDAARGALDHVLTAPGRVLELGVDAEVGDWALSGVLLFVVILVWTVFSARRQAKSARRRPKKNVRSTGNVQQNSNV